MPTISYNSYVIPDTAFFGKFSIRESYTEVHFSCNFILKASSEAALVTACEAAESALRVRNKNLEVTFGSTAEYSFSHTTNSGILAVPSIDKIPDKTSTRLSRSYRFSVAIQRPADEAGYNYRQSAQIQLSQNIKGRKILSISGKYTAGGSNSAKQNYDAYAETWANSIATSLLGSNKYEVLDTSFSYEQENKILSFSFSYQQKIDIEVTYNGYDIPTSYNTFNFSETYESLSFSCEFAIDHAAAAAAETALRIWNAALLMKFDGSTVYDYDPSDNTGFLAQPTLAQISNTTDDDTKRFYRFSLVCQLPANKATYGYRRSGGFAISYDPSRRRTVNFTVVYTAGGANSALDNYEAGAKVWAASILTSLGGTYELVNESPRPDMENKIVQASLTYEEIFANQTQSQLNDPKIVLGQCDYSIGMDQEIGQSLTGGYIPNSQVVVTLNYSARIDKDQTSAETDIEDTYRTLVRPWIIAHARDVLGLSNKTQVGTGYIVQSERYNINPSNYAVSGSISFSAPKTLQDIVSLSETIARFKNAGLIPRKIWNGIPNTYNVYGLGSEERLSRSIRVMQLGTEPSDPVPYPGKYLRLSQRPSLEVKKVGVGSAGGSLNAVLLYIKTFQEEYLLVEQEQ